MAIDPNSSSSTSTTNWIGNGHPKSRSSTRPSSARRSSKNTRTHDSHLDYNGTCLSFPQRQGTFAGHGGNVGVALVRFFDGAGSTGCFLSGRTSPGQDRGVMRAVISRPAKSFNSIPCCTSGRKTVSDSSYSQPSPISPLLENSKGTWKKHPSGVRSLRGGLPIRGSHSIGPDELEAKVLMGCSTARVKNFMRS